MRILRITFILLITYLITWVAFSATGLAKDGPKYQDSDNLGWIFLVENILAFPINLINKNYPFFLNHTEGPMERPAHPEIFIGINFVLQVVLVYFGMWLVRKPNR